MDLIHVILIKNGQVSEVDIRPSHEDIERLLGTTFWVIQRISRGDVMFRGESNYPGIADFYFEGKPCCGTGVIARYAEYGDLDSPLLTVGEVRELVK